MAIDKLKEDTVIVFIDGSNLHLTPEPVQKAMSSKPALGPLPMVAVFDPTVEENLGAIGYYAMKDPNGFNEVMDSLAEHRGKQVEKVVRRLPETWKDTRGRTMEATYVNSTADEVTFRLRNGKSSTLKLTRLSEASQKRVAELAQQ